MFLQKYKPSSVYGMAANRYQVSQLERAVAAWKRGTAIVLSGPAGCGKNLAIELAAKKFCLSVINDGIEDLLKASTESSVWSKGRLLVGDLDAEISVGDVAKLAETSVWPVVFVTEDIYRRNLSELRKSDCVAVINFQKANISELSSFLKKICTAEGISCNDRMLYELAHRSDGDVRFAVTALESLSSVDADAVQTIERDRIECLFDKLDSVFRRSLTQDADVEDISAWILENVHGRYSGSELAQAYRCLASADRFERGGLDAFAGALMRVMPVVKTQVRYSTPTRFLSNLDSDVLSDIAVHAHCSTKKAKSYLRLIKHSSGRFK